MSEKSDFYGYQTIGMGIVNQAPMVRITGPPEFLELLAAVLEELGDNLNPTPEEVDAAIKKVKEG